MTIDRWQHIETLYHEMLARPVHEREAALVTACAGDASLHAEVQSLLDQPQSAAGFLATPALEIAAHYCSPAHSPLTGRRLGVFELQGLLGVGGMGDVYRARDTKLRREVAVKILPRAFQDDRDRLVRFEQEAQVLASLNHPHIGAIYGLEEAGDTRCIVMELIEGETLQSRIKKGPMPVGEAVTIAQQIAEALEAAHEKGVIHRDLKPGNVIITSDGRVKVLDFGLAKVMEPIGAPSDLSQPPTPAIPAMTQAGMILGTAGYMSPEQARGQAIDKRTDIWAFGCVLYEMLTGRAAFPGDTPSDTIAAILERQPEWAALPAHTPAGIRQLLRRCLDKDLKRRLHDIADARIEIDDVQNGTQDGLTAQAPAGHRWPLAWMSTLAFVALIAAGTIVWALRPAPTAPEARLEINTPPSRDSSLAISPDGMKIVFAARSEGQSRLWLRTLDSPEAHPLPGTERASSPFWSSDGRSVGFFLDDARQLKRIDIAEGSVQTLASAPAPRGGAWSKDGTIIFATNPGNPIFRIARGGELVAVTRFESTQQGEQSTPQFLPDGRHFLFFVTGSPEARGVHLGQLDGLETKRLFDADAPAVYTTGHLIFIREGKLLAQAFDPDRLELKGDPFPIAEHVARGTGVSASDAGVIAYRTPSADSGQRQLVRVDRSGREIERVVYQDAAAQGPSLSRNGLRVAVFRMLDGNMDIWTYETGRRIWERITFDPGDDIFPLWSPDGTRMVYGSNRNGGRMNLYRKPVSAPTASEELLLSTSQPKFPMDWSADGRFVLYDSLDPKRGMDIWALPLEGDGKPFAVVQTNFNERLAQFSPDGKWIAYESDKTGRFEIYIQPFQGPGGDSRVSIDGGAQVRWNPSGKELFYVAADDRLMAVPIRFSSIDKTVEAGTPMALFATNVGGAAINTNRQQYAVAPDGQSFVLNSAVEEAGESHITVILNWKPKR
jgi:serine/threonine protein kinase